MLNKAVMGDQCLTATCLPAMEEFVSMEVTVSGTLKSCMWFEQQKHLGKEEEKMIALL